MATKKEKIRKHLQKKPHDKIADIAKACGASVPLVSGVKREMGLVRPSRRGRPPATKVGMAARAAALNPEDVAQLKEAVKLAGTKEDLLKIIDSVEKAGGLDAIRIQIQAYQELQSIFE